MKERGEKKKKKKERKIYIKPVSLSNNDEILIVSPPIGGRRHGRKEGRKEKKFPRETLEVLTNEISRSIVG